MNWLRKLLRPNGHDEINRLKSELIKNREKQLKDVTKINKKIKLFIESGEIELVIKDIKKISEGL